MAILSDMDDAEIPDSHNKIQHLVVSKSFQSFLCVNFCQLHLLNDFASVRLHCWICQDFWCDEYGSQTMVRCSRPSHSNTLPELYEYGWITSWKLRLPEKEPLISHVYTVYNTVWPGMHMWWWLPATSGSNEWAPSRPADRFCCRFFICFGG